MRELLLELGTKNEFAILKMWNETTEHKSEKYIFRLTGKYGHFTYDSQNQIFSIANRHVLSMLRDNKYIPLWEKITGLKIKSIDTF